jgi:hypothetical protein
MVEARAEVAKPAAFDVGLFFLLSHPLHRFVHTYHDTHVEKNFG